MAALYLNQEFSRWEDFFEAVAIHCRQTFQPFIKSSSKSVECSNSRLKPGQAGYPPELGYVYFVYKCTHRGTFRSLSKGMRNVKSLKQGCQAKIYAALDKETRSKIIVKQLNENHCHDIGPELYCQYTKQKQSLSADERKVVEKMHKKAESKLKDLKVHREVDAQKMGPRNPNKSYTQEQLLEATLRIQNGEIEISKASREYGIPYATLRDRLAARRQSLENPRTILTAEEEFKLVHWLLELAKRGFQKSPEEILDAVRDVVSGRAPGEEATVDKQLLTKKWTRAFFRRNPEVALHYTAMLYGEDGKSSGRPSSPGSWLSHLKTYIDSSDSTLLFSPERLYTAGEIYFRFSPIEQTVVACEGTKPTLKSDGNLSITVVGCASASGRYLPPLAVFPFTDVPLYNPLREFDDALFQISPSGLLTRHVFFSWLRDCFIPAVADLPKPVALFVNCLGAHSSHLHTLDICIENGILLYCLQDQNSGPTPPLEQRFFKHIKQVWNSEIGPSVTLRRKTESDQIFAAVLKAAWTAEVNWEMAVDGFAWSGIFPFCPVGILNLLPETSHQNAGLPSQGLPNINPKFEPPSPTEEEPLEKLPAPQTSKGSNREREMFLGSDVIPHLFPQVAAFPSNPQPPLQSNCAADQAKAAKILCHNSSEGPENSKVRQASQANAALRQLLNSGPALASNPCLPPTLPYPLSNSSPQAPDPLSNSSSQASMKDSSLIHHIKLLLEMAFSYGKTTSMDIIEKYAAGTLDPICFKDMVDVLNTLLRPGKNTSATSGIVPSVSNQPPSVPNALTDHSPDQPHPRPYMQIQGSSEHSDTIPDTLVQCSSSQSDAITQSAVDQSQPRPYMQLQCSSDQSRTTPDTIVQGFPDQPQVELGPMTQPLIASDTVRGSSEQLHSRPLLQSHSSSDQSQSLHSSLDQSQSTQSSPNRSLSLSEAFNQGCPDLSVSVSQVFNQSRTNQPQSLSDSFSRGCTDQLQSGPQEFNQSSDDQSQSSPDAFTLNSFSEPKSTPYPLLLIPHSTNETQGGVPLTAAMTSKELNEYLEKKEKERRETQQSKELSSQKGEKFIDENTKGKRRMTNNEYKGQQEDENGEKRLRPEGSVYINDYCQNDVGDINIGHDHGKESYSQNNNATNNDHVVRYCEDEGDNDNGHLEGSYQHDEVRYNNGRDENSYQDSQVNFDNGHDEGSYFS